MNTASAKITKLTWSKNRPFYLNALMVHKIPESDNYFSVDRSLLLIRNDMNFGVGAHFFARFQTNFQRKKSCQGPNIYVKSVWKGRSPTKEETIYFFAFVRDAAAALIDAEPVLRQLVLWDLGIGLIMSLWTASSFLRKTRTDQTLRCMEREITNSFPSRLYSGDRWCGTSVTAVGPLRYCFHIENEPLVRFLLPVLQSYVDFFE